MFLCRGYDLQNCRCSSIHMKYLCSHPPLNRGHGGRFKFFKRFLGLYMLKKQFSDPFCLAVNFVSFQCVGLHKSSVKQIVLHNILCESMEQQNMVSLCPVHVVVWTQLSLLGRYFYNILTLFLKIFSQL
jgi:hypothetical protein